MNAFMPEFKPEMRTFVIDRIPTEVKVFKNAKTWMQHLVKHIGSRSEPWAQCLKTLNMGEVYRVVDRIGNISKDPYLKEFLKLCQKEEEKAVDIYRKGQALYAIVAPKVAELIVGGIGFPRYAVARAQIDTMKKTKTDVPLILVITEPCSAFAVIKRFTLKTIFFPKGAGANPKTRLAVAQRYAFNKCGKEISQGRKAYWNDNRGGKGYSIEPQDLRVFTERTFFGLAK